MSVKAPKRTLEAQDALLKDHLKRSEEHLIAAVLLFEEAVKPKREDKFVKRLIQAQEIVTDLYRQELVRKAVRRAPRAVKRAIL